MDRCKFYWRMSTVGSQSTFRLRCDKKEVFEACSELTEYWPFFWKLFIGGIFSFWRYFSPPLNLRKSIILIQHGMISLISNPWTGEWWPTFMFLSPVWSAGFIEKVVDSLGSRVVYYLLFMFLFLLLGKFYIIMFVILILVGYFQYRGATHSWISSNCCLHGRTVNIEAIWYISRWMFWTTLDYFFRLLRYLELVSSILELFHLRWVKL